MVGISSKGGGLALIRLHGRPGSETSSRWELRRLKNVIFFNHAQLEERRPFMTRN